MQQTFIGLKALLLDMDPSRAPPNMKIILATALAYTKDLLIVTPVMLIHIYLDR